MENITAKSGSGRPSLSKNQPLEKKAAEKIGGENDEIAEVEDIGRGFDRVAAEPRCIGDEGAILENQGGTEESEAAFDKEQDAEKGRNHQDQGVEKFSEAHRSNRLLLKSAVTSVFSTDLWFDCN